MKQTLLISSIFLSAFSASANSFSSLWGGAGLAKTYNFGLSPSVGFTYYRGVAYGVGLGATVFYQKYNMYYDEQTYKVTGSSVRFNGAYAFVAPMFVFHLSRSGQTQAYVNIGVGYSVGTQDSVRKWSGADWASNTGKYDSLIDGSKTLNKMAFRAGIGLTEYYSLGRNWKLSITEDVGILPSALATYTDDSNPNLNSDMPRFFKPLMCSIRMGITYRTRTEGEASGHKKMSRH